LKRKYNEQLNEFLNRVLAAIVHQKRCWFGMV